MTGCSLADRGSAMSKLVAFSHRKAFHKDRKDVQALFPDAPLDDDTPPLERLLDVFQAAQAEQMYLLLDHVPESGESLVRRYLNEQGSELTGPERFHLEVLAESAVRPYEIRRVLPGKAMILHDLWSRKNLHVGETEMSQGLRPMEILVARTLSMLSGPEVMAVGHHVFPELCSSRLTAWLGTLSHELGETALFKTLPPLIHSQWLSFVTHPPVPFPGSSSPGDLIVHRIHFAPLDRRKLKCALIDSPDFVRRAGDDAWRGGEAWEWSIPIEMEFRFSLGDLILAESVVWLETENEKMGIRGRELLEALAPGALCYKGTSLEAPPGLFGEGPDGPESPRPEDSGGCSERLISGISDELHEDLQRHLSQRCRAWIDQPLPQLKNRTPREAARTDPERVAEILQGFETSSELFGGDDWSWLWEELGVERPE